MTGGRIGAGVDGWSRGGSVRIAVALLSTGLLVAMAFEASTGEASSSKPLAPVRTELPPAERAGVPTGGTSGASLVGTAGPGEGSAVPPEDENAAEDTGAEPAGSRAAVPGSLERRRRAFPARGTSFAWRPLHDRVDGMLWREALSPDGPPPAARLPSTFHGVGFPALERVVSLPEERRRDWAPLIAWAEPDDPDGRLREPLPHVRCMGLSPQAVARRAARVESDVLALSIEHGVSASLVKALIAAESCFDPEAISSAGALGLMQLMPETADWLGTGDPADVLGNLDGGIRYLASLEERFGDIELALAAYNAGPGNVRRHGGVPPFAETRAYVRKVLAFHRRYVAASTLAARLGTVR